MLRKAGIEHRLLRYDYRPDCGAEQAAADLGVEPQRMYKSLVAKAGAELVFALVPADSELSLKKLAAAAGAKHAAMAQPRDAERAADYGLTSGQQGFLEWVRRVAADLADVPPVHGAVNRPLVTRLGELGLLRALFGGEPDEPPRDAAAMQLCLLREALAEVIAELSAEAQTRPA